MLSDSQTFYFKNVSIYSLHSRILGYNSNFQCKNHIHHHQTFLNVGILLWINYQLYCLASEPTIA